MTRKIALFLSFLLILGNITILFSSCDRSDEGEYSLKEALEIYENGDKIEGMAALREVEGKKAAKERKEIYLSMFSQEFYDSVHDAKVGDILTFGEMEQDDNESNGVEDITWRVIDRDEEGRILVISELGLEAVQYHKKAEEITWEDSFIRSWLNETFIKDVFTEEIQSVIPLTHVENKDNPLYGTDGGNDTYDKIFLLSIDEANQYFKSNRDRMTSATETAQVHYAYSDPFGNTAWRLRSPSFEPNKAAVIADTGEVFVGAHHLVTDRYFSVRPAFWIDLT